jgi:hypothetical protein
MNVARPRVVLSRLALLSSLFALPMVVGAAVPATVDAARPDATAPAAVPAASGSIDCIEVKLFAVAEEKVDGQTDRAEKIPARNLELIQAGVVKHLPKEARGVTAIAAGSSTCPNPATAATLGGDILDFRKGNMALRYLVGFGAGSQKVRVRLTLSRSDGAQIAQSEIADTKWGGAFGGTNTKGLDDFAEKAAEAAAKALKGH